MHTRVCTLLCAAGGHFEATVITDQVLHRGDRTLSRSLIAPTAACLCLALSGSALAQDDAQSADGASAEVKAAKPIPRESEEFPISGFVRTSYRFNHSNFASTESDNVDLGFGVGTLQAVLFYQPTPKIFLYSALWFDKALHEGFERPPLSPAPSTRSRTTQSRDLLVGGQYNLGTIPGIGVMVFTNMDFSIPTSQLSRTSGQMLSVSPGLQLVRPIPGGVVTLNGSAFYNFNEDPTLQIDCDVAPQNCAVSGADLGSPVLESGVGGSLGVNYRIAKGLLFRGGYDITSFFNANSVERDEFTAPVDGIQEGTQLATLHGTSFSLQLAFKQPGGGANQALNDLQGEGANEESFLNNLQFAIAMRTLMPLYDQQGDSVTNPIFDFESDTHRRTQYTVSITGLF
ncbi:MAG: hypothetical protein ACE366_24265 [Bradymonadia bacterium]